MSKKIVFTYPKTTFDSSTGESELVEPEAEIELDDITPIKTITVDRVCMPKGFLVPGSAHLAYRASNSSVYYYSMYQAGIETRRFTNIRHAELVLTQWMDALIAFHVLADTVNFKINESRDHIDVRSDAAGGVARIAFVTSDFVSGGPEAVDISFVKWLSKAVGIPWVEKGTSVVTHGLVLEPDIWTRCDYFDQHGGVNEIFMTSLRLAEFWTKYVTTASERELNSTLIAIPVPTIKTRSIKQQQSDVEDTLRYHMDGFFYERYIWSQRKSLTPVSLVADPPVEIANFDIRFYSIIDDLVIPIYFIADTTITLHVESEMALEMEEEEPPFQYGGGRD